MPPSFNPSSFGGRKAVMQEVGEVPCSVPPRGRRQVFTSNDAHQVPLSRKTAEGIRQTSSGSNMGFVGGEDARVAVFIEGFAQGFSTLHPVEHHRFDELGFRTFSGLFTYG